MPSGRSIVVRSLLAAALLASASGASPAPAWRTDFEAAQAEARRLDRPLLVHFHAEWCVPCKQMDRDVLHAPGFLALASRHVVPVKLDVDHHRDVAARYGVESIPADLFLTPEGRVLGSMNGLRSKDDYLRRVAAVETQYSRLRDLYLARSDGKTPVRPTLDGTGPRFPTLDAPVIEPDPSPHISAGPRIKPRTDGSVLVGLKGHSPVALFKSRAWRKGSPKFAWEHQGLTYLMCSDEELEAFRDDAERYAPCLLGCDPVLYYDEGRALPGSTGFAAFFEDRLYLFTSAETRAKFRESPDRYSRRRTVLLIEELESVLR